MQSLVYSLLIFIFTNIIWFTLQLPSFNCAFILSTLAIVGLALVYDPQRMRKVIIAVPVTVTFSYMLPSNLNPALRIAVAAIYTVVIILMLKFDFHKLRFAMKMLFKARSVINAVIIPLFKKTAIIIFTVVIPSGLILTSNISVTTAIYVQIGAMVLMFLCNHLTKEFYCALIITTTSILLNFVKGPTWDIMDPADIFNMIMVASAILLIIFLCIGLLSDFYFIQKVGFIVVIMNVTIITVEILTMFTNSFSTHDQLLAITDDRIIITFTITISLVLVLLLMNLFSS